MQGLIVITVMLVISIFTYMETKRNDISTSFSLNAYRAANVASNIMQYSDMLTQYAIADANYPKLHDNDYSQGANVGHVTLLDYNANNIQAYSQKNLMLFLNYSSAVFNYGPTPTSNDDSTQIAKLYLVTTFSDYVNGLKTYKNISLDQVMGELADKYNQHLYQGNSVSWVVPILLKQDGACHAIAIYGQVPNDINNIKQSDSIKILFNQFCTQLQGAGYVMQKYVYIATVVPSAS